jgi:hypothetical protein
MKKVFLGVLVLLFAFSGICFAETSGDILKKGSQAYTNGDFETAAEWYRKAAEQGDATGQYLLGLMYRYGKGVSQDSVEAAKWLLKAAEQGHARSQFNLAVMSELGKGVSKSQTEAIKWYQKAAEQGDAQAQHNLACFYYLGKGVSKNFETAAEWYRKAAEQGIVKSQYALGVMYFKGQGVSQNYKHAYIWFSLAALSLSEDSQGSNNLKEQLERVKKLKDEAAKKLSPQQMEEAQEIVNSIKTPKKS